ncbi:MAG: GTPase HflX [Candidatus Hydrogenedens sp.]|nr:GTPase HflX [Candidatus Hydrogenedens sp.]
MQVSGNTKGLKPSQLKALEKLSERRPNPDYLVTPEQARALTEASLDIQRQIGLLIDRRGRVTNVVVGDAKQVFLPEFPRRGLDRLSGLRLVHTHLIDPKLNDDDLTDLALLRLDCIAAIWVEDNGLPGPVQMAHLLPANEGGEPWRVLEPVSVHDLEPDMLELLESLDEEFERMRAPRRAGDTRDRAILLHVSKLPPSVAQDSVDELKELARSAGLNVVHTVIQRRPPDPKYVTGQGRLKEAIIKAMQLGAEVMIFDQDLSPSQVRSLSDMTDLKILDRTQLILDIFAQHAVTREGKLQVELAQLRYLLPLLNVRQTALSRLTGGIGGRGPGETRLEIDRRRARDRIARLEREVNKLGERRELRRHVRTEKAVPTVAVVGYTNAGKSTLLNSLTQSEVIAENALFATLNPVSRRLRFPEEREVVITDTVGFIRNLPEDLMAAFRTTFEELQDADLLLHVVDASSHDIEAKYETVERVLKELELDQKPTICVLNKVDRCDPETLQGLLDHFAAIPICALDRESFTPLMEIMESLLWADTSAAS